MSNAELPRPRYEETNCSGSELVVVVVEVVEVVEVAYTPDDANPRRRPEAFPAKLLGMGARYCSMLLPVVAGQVMDAPLRCGEVG